MIFREALISDIPQIQVVRNLVKENMLSDPALVNDADCEEFMTVRGKGWVCIIDDRVTGFAIADLKEDNIWALFVDPHFERKRYWQNLTSADDGLVFFATKRICMAGNGSRNKSRCFL